MVSAQAQSLERIALLYPGDLGAAFGSRLVRAGFCVASWLRERSERTRRAASAAGLIARDSLDALLADADLVVSLVPQQHALATARHCAEILRAQGVAGARNPQAEGLLYLDANSIAPATAREIARNLEAVGARAVDGAFLGSARDLGTRGALLLSGADAAGLASELARALPVRVVGAAIGDASAFKLCFSGFNKAVVAAGFESLCAAQRAGFGEELLAALREFYPGTVEALERQMPTYPRHASRRAQEMADVGAWLAEQGSESSLADASRAVFGRLARASLDASRSYRVPDLMRALEPGSAAGAGAAPDRIHPPGVQARDVHEGSAMTADQKPQSSELHPGPGFRIRHEIRRPDPALVAAFRGFEGPMISDLMNRLYTMRPEIQNQTDTDLMPLVGPACTVKVFPGDNLMVHAALDVARPGDVLVIDAGGSQMNAVLGDLVSNKARHRGIAGIVVDGLVRDIDGIREARIPVFAIGVTPVGPLHRGPGEINFPIQCGGIVVKPGDLIFGDNNGVVVVPLEIADELLKRCQQKTEQEAAYVASVKQGKFSNAWVHVELASSGCLVIDAQD